MLKYASRIFHYLKEASCKIGEAGGKEEGQRVGRGIRKWGGRRKRSSSSRRRKRRWKTMMKNRR
jgi:hypothetical protein